MAPSADGTLSARKELSPAERLSVALAASDRKGAEGLAVEASERRQRAAATVEAGEFQAGFGDAQQDGLLAV